MRRFFMVSVLLLSLLIVSGFIPFQQTNQIAILNRSGQSTSQITDGDSIQIQLTLSQPVTQQQNVNFLLGNTTVASCSIPEGKTSCKTDSFLSLGWYWNLNGEPQDISPLLATDNHGNVIAQTDITIKPRPVVMVHGFLSNPE